MVASSGNRITVGRASDNALVIAHRSVSAHHAELHFDGEQFLLRDLSSSNGTFVNGERVTSATLQDGDTVHLGPVALKFDNGQLQIHVELEPDDPTPDTKTNRKPALAAALVLVIGFAVAVPLLVQQSDDTNLTTALPETPVTTAPTTPESNPPTSTVPVTTVVPTTSRAPATTATQTTVAATTTAAPTTTLVPTTAVPTTTAAPTTTTKTPAEIAAEAILTSTYQWGVYSERTSRLQGLLAIPADGFYGQGTRTAHVAALTGRGLSTSGVPDPPPPTTAPPATTLPPTTTSAPATPGGPDWEELARSVVQVFASCSDGLYSGSGTVVLDGSYVLTNAHVITDEYGNFCDLWILAADSASESPQWFADGRVIPTAYDPSIDLAVIRLVDLGGVPTFAAGRDPIDIKNIELGLGDDLKILGYPSMGGDMITMTSGEHSGWYDGAEGELYKTSAKAGPGVSGGATFDAGTGEFVGVPTFVTSGPIGDGLGLIRPNSYILQYLEIAKNAG